MFDYDKHTYRDVLSNLESDYTSFDCAFKSRFIYSLCEDGHDEAVQLMNSSGLESIAIEGLKIPYRSELANVILNKTGPEWFGVTIQITNRNPFNAACSVMCGDN